MKIGRHFVTLSLIISAAAHSAALPAGTLPTSAASAIQTLLSLKKPLLEKKDLAILKPVGASKVVIWVRTDTGWLGSQYARESLQGWYPADAGGQRPEMEVENAFRDIRAATGGVQRWPRSADQRDAIHPSDTVHGTCCEQPDSRLCTEWNGRWYQYKGDSVHDTMSGILTPSAKDWLLKQSYPRADVTLIYVGPIGDALFGYKTSPAGWELVSIAITGEC